MRRVWNRRSGRIQNGELIDMLRIDLMLRIVPIWQQARFAATAPSRAGNRPSIRQIRSK